ncbi:DUF397 domain-containing protein [Sphaerisporangium sp. NPDC088356]|uniref:DUF397 domain-containing protein n=1 Tax=Sphaerisporangium sp. NPDC088356 TaxID=3154871 RepID=UPI00341BB4AF
MSETPDLSRAVWRKSRRSGANGACVEVAAIGGVVAVRDSKNPGSAVLALGLSGWHTFISGVKSGDLQPTA